MPAVASLSGLWTRALIAWPDGRRDTTTSVAWLQGPSLYADLRQPPGLHVTASSLRGLTMPDCLQLASQEAFAGVFLARGETFEWVRLIDFQPSHGTRDIGRLFWQGETLVEEGVESAYTEHWHRAPAARTPCASFALQATDDGSWGCLVRAGNLFMYARGRAAPAAGGSLAEAIAGAATLREAQDVLDFEISLGEIASGGWRIRRSTLPFRAAMDLPRHAHGAAGLCITDTAPDGTARPRHWTITAAEGDAASLLAPSGIVIA